MPDQTPKLICSIGEFAAFCVEKGVYNSNKNSNKSVLYEHFSQVYTVKEEFIEYAEKAFEEASENAVENKDVFKVDGRNKYLKEELMKGNGYAKKCAALHFYILNHFPLLGIRLNKKVFRSEFVEGIFIPQNENLKPIPEGVQRGSMEGDAIDVRPNLTLSDPLNGELPISPIEEPSVIAPLEIPPEPMPQRTIAPDGLDNKIVKFREGTASEDFGQQRDASLSPPAAIELNQAKRCAEQAGEDEHRGTTGPPETADPQNVRWRRLNVFSSFCKRHWKSIGVAGTLIIMVASMAATMLTYTSLPLQGTALAELWLTGIQSDDQTRAPSGYVFQPTDKVGIRVSLGADAAGQHWIGLYKVMSTDGKAWLIAQDTGYQGVPTRFETTVDKLAIPELGHFAIRIRRCANNCDEFYEELGDTATAQPATAERLNSVIDIEGREWIIYRVRVRG